LLMGRSRMILVMHGWAYEYVCKTGRNNMQSEM